MSGLKVLEFALHRLKFSSLLIALAASFVSPAGAAQLFELRLPQAVTAIQSSDAGTFVIIGAETFRLKACETAAGLCLSTEAPPKQLRKLPAGGLPDGTVAISASGDIRQAWYARPTTRYAHGVLGDAIEGGSLIVATRNGNRREFVLPEAQVFEDITPRIHDLDGDGQNEVIAIRSSKTGGAAVVLYGLRDGVLTELGESTENGRPNRWLNIASIVDGSEGGPATIYAIRTPHIGGRLFSLTYSGGGVSEQNDIASDVSNHIIGSRELGMSATGDFGGDGKVEFVVPSQDRMRLRFPLSDRPDIALPEAIDKAIVFLDGRIVTATEAGRLLVIVP
jgi:hypothetical protein